MYVAVTQPVKSDYIKVFQKIARKLKVSTIYQMNFNFQVI